ncbi:efflux RND transporter permease subunit [Oceanibium sediminis]|uniref:efflux RND transporter permease subunit n=1 Tax=Oceanibium sediminis TaxID=2026339 RepID=UPI000DD33599|nr:efflux RND transporter permease subunit [Oceanibium sediminis]
MAGGRITEGAGGILSYFTRHRTAANLLLVILIALGVAAGSQIRSQFFPDVVIDNVSVRVNWDGAGPEDVDNAIIALLEPALLGVEGIESTSSTAREGSARIDIDFEPGWDMARATEDVTTAVNTVNNLPEGADDPVIRRGAWRDRVTDVVISGPVSPEQLGRYSDEFVARLFREGITRTTIRGIAAPLVEVEVSEANLIRHDVTLSGIADAIGAEAEADPAGDVAGGTARVRTGVEKRTAEEIADIVVRSNPDGSKLRVADVAEIRVLGADAGRTYYKGPDPAISIRVDRADQGDAIAMQAAVSRVAAELQPLLPEGVQIDLIRTRAEAITDRLDILLDNGLMGLGLVVLLLFLFLSARTAFWVAAGIPVAMFAAVALMYAAGLTINMISLFALIICLGIVVDDAIVVGEHADFRHHRLGEPPAVAAENAARRMALPVFSATITTVLAFFALTVVGGRFGSLIADIPFTVIVVLIASLVECFLILPSHMHHALAAQARGDKWYDWPSRTVNKGFRWVRHSLFRPAMALVIRLRYPVLAAAVLALAMAAGQFLRGDVTWRFFNAPERGSISGNIAMLPGATREDTLEMVRELQRATDATAAAFAAEHGANPVTFALAEIGGSTGRGLAGADTKDPDQLGSIAIELIDADLRPYSSFAFLGALQEEVRNHPMLETLSFRGWRSGPGGDALDVKFFGADATTLKAAAEDLKAAVSRYPEVSAVEDSLSYDKTELVLELTPLGQNLGFTIDGVGRELRQRLGGIKAAEFPVGVRTGKVEVKLPDEELTADFLERTRLRTPDGAYVQLSDIVSVSSGLGFSTVRRENGLRLIEVTGDISEDDPERAAEIMAELQDTILPEIAGIHGVEFQLSGLAEQERDFLSDAALGFGLCLLGIYLTLCWIFASWTRPFVVMAVIPFGIIGVIWGHMAWDVPLSMFSVVGMIGMTGIIINDSIVLVTTIDEYAEKRGLIPAIIDAAADRLRPILLTTATTVLGLAPLLYESSQQAQFLKPTVITLCYGLGVGMFLVLLIVPSLVAMQLDAGRILRSLRRARSGARRQPLLVRLALLGSGLGSLGVLALTVGTYVIRGEPGALVAAVQAGLPALPDGLAVIVTLVLGLFVVFAVVLALSTLAMPRRQRMG